jgi:hypothetical protein
MSGIIKPLGVSVVCNTANINTYSNAKLVRLTCTANTANGYVVTCKYANGTTNYSVVITGGQSLIVEKNPTDTLESNDIGTTLVRGTSIAYRN